RDHPDTHGAARPRRRSPGAREPLCRPGAPRRRALDRVTPGELTRAPRADAAPARCPAGPAQRRGDAGHHAEPRGSAQRALPLAGGRCGARRDDVRLRHRSTDAGPDVGRSRPAGPASVSPLRLHAAVTGALGETARGRPGGVLGLVASRGARKEEIRMDDRALDHTRRLAQLAMAGRLSRREVLRRGAALGLSAPALITLLAACGGGESAGSTSATGGGGSTPASGSETPASGTSTTETGSSDGPKKGGRAVIALIQEPGQMNEFFNSQSGSFLSVLVVEPLFIADANGEYQPVLAAEVPTIENGGISPDSLTITYKLKE